MTLTFRYPAELEGLLPPPVPAALGLPDWFKAMPPQAFNAVNSFIGDSQALSAVHRRDDVWLFASVDLRPQGR
jgi:hypothetical protein